MGGEIFKICNRGPPYNSLPKSTSESSKSVMDIFFEAPLTHKSYEILTKKIKEIGNFLLKIPRYLGKEDRDTSRREIRYWSTFQNNIRDMEFSEPP